MLKQEAYWKQTVMIKKTTLAALLLSVCCLTVSAAKQPKFDRGIEQKTFIPKGQWMAGATFSYIEYDANNYQWMVIEDLNSLGYTFKVSPTVCYFFRDNLAIGGRFTYARTLSDLGNISMSFGDDLNIELNDLYMKTHMFTTTIFSRAYLNMGDSKRFGLFNEVAVSYGYGQGNSTNTFNDEPTAIHTDKHNLRLGVSPGLTCFINNYVAIEASVDVMGLDFRWDNQKINQVEDGKFRSSGANFKINLFSINLGMTFYY